MPSIMPSIILGILTLSNDALLDRPLT